MKVAIAQINTIIGNFKRHYDRITEASKSAVTSGCDLIVFPELVIPGYPPRDLLEKQDFIEANRRCLDRLISDIRGIGVICGYVAENPEDGGNPLFNSAVLFEDGEVLLQARKSLLPAYDIFDERRYFEPGKTSSLFAYKGRRLGLTICEDVWNDKDIFTRRIYDRDPVAQLADAGADLIINISASPFHVGKSQFRRRILSNICKKYRLPLIYANQVGGNDSILFEGMSAAFDPEGKMVARAYDFREDLITVDFDAMDGDLRPVSESGEEATLRALVMGTRDYVEKCGFSKAVVGLSGGIDSALTLWIAAKALGPENVRAIFMPSRYTSQDNYTDTEKLAASLGTPYQVIPIDPIFDVFLENLSPGTETAGLGLMEQNVQARIRGTLLMAVSNREGSLLLATGNKSELAVGYCTLYGDMSGALAVISDLPKTQVYNVSKWINSDGEIIPLSIIEKAPSAELKPDQRDQDDLPPYDLLDKILVGYVEELKGIEELVAEGFDRAVVEDIVSRVDRNEYKRHQAPPGLRVTSKAFGYGRRYPLAQRFRHGSSFD